MWLWRDRERRVGIIKEGQNWHIVNEWNNNINCHNVSSSSVKKNITGKNICI